MEEGREGERERKGGGKRVNREGRRERIGVERKGK